MSSAVVTAIYGVPINQAIHNKMLEMEEDPDSGWFEDKNGTCGFTTLYSGHAMRTVGYCGVKLDGFNEFKDVRVSKLKLEPTDKQKKEAQERIDALPEAFDDLVGDPDVFFVMSTT